MPTYEYACESCGNRYEKREGFDAKARQKCPKCRRATAQRVLFAPPVVFKGSGFYKTDSRGSDTSGGESSPATATPSVPDLGAAGHGHSHGPGGHSHGPTPEAPAPAADAPKKGKAAKEAPSTEGAAAG